LIIQKVWLFLAETGAAKQKFAGLSAEARPKWRTRPFKPPK